MKETNNSRRPKRDVWSFFKNERGTSGASGGKGEERGNNMSYGEEGTEGNTLRIGEGFL